MTQAQLGEKVGTCYQTVSNWEAGRGLPLLRLRASIAEILHIPPGKEPWAQSPLSTLADCRIRHNLSQEYLARRIGVPRGVLARWEQQRAVPIEYSHILAEFLEVPLGEEPWETKACTFNSETAVRFHPERLQGRRRAAGLTVEEAAELVDVSDEAWRVWEDGQSAPLEHSLPPIAKALGCSIEDILHTPKTVRDRRRLTGLTQQQVADRLGVEHSTIAMWEIKGKTPLGYRQKLAEILAIPAGEEPWADQEESPSGLSERRLILGMTRADVAEAVNASPRTVGHWEAGVPVHPLYREALAQVLQISPDDLPIPYLTRENAALYYQRLDRRLTQRQVAERVGVAAADISGWEQGMRVSPRHRQRLAEVLNIPLGEEPWAGGNSMSDLKKWRTITGFTQVEVARRLGIHPTTYSDWERGRHIPVKQRLRLAVVLDIPLGEEPWASAENHPRHHIYGHLGSQDA